MKIKTRRLINRYSYDACCLFLLACVLMVFYIVMRSLPLILHSVGIV